MSNLADQLFDATFAQRRAEDAFIDAAMAIVGDHEWWQDLSWDWYDRSFEFVGVTVGQDLTDEQLAAFGALGFSQCWLNYTDGTERHYGCKAPSRGNARKGSRGVDIFAPIERAIAAFDMDVGPDRLTIKQARRALSVLKLESDSRQ
jgi:hypothetical protein